MLRILNKLLTILPLLLILLISDTYAQNILDDFEDEESITLGNSENAPQLYSETIKVISPSRKIFILTNNNNSFSKGDFISILLGNKLVCRALVAKTTDENLSGIKIVKIYDTSLWEQLIVGKEVLILRGDDSFYTNAGKVKEQKPTSKVNDEDDLFNMSTFNDDEGNFEDNSKRLIRPDNLLSAGIGMIGGKNIDGESTRYTHFNASWAYQVADNFWAEINGGVNQIVDFPATSLDTRLISISAKMKLTFQLPFYSYLLPYVGYQVIMPSSKDAGVDASGETSQEELDRELQLVDDLRKNTVIFGVTVLKRIVPGWFIRADLGNDILSAGLTLEF